MSYAVWAYVDTAMFPFGLVFVIAIGNDDQ